METRTLQTKALEAPQMTTLAVSALLTIALASVAVAKDHPTTANYFPLHNGDSWAYVIDTQGIINPPQNPYPLEQVEVTGVRGEGFEVSNYAFGLGDAPINFIANMEDPVTVMESNGFETGVWYRFQEGAPVDLPSFANDCIHGSKGTVIGLTDLRVPAGDFRNCLEIRYGAGPCGKTHLVREVFAPAFGLIQRQIVTPEGDLQTWSLKVAVVNGQTIGQVGGNRSALSAAPGMQSSNWGTIKATYGN